MKKTYYHATDEKNMLSILREGIHTGSDGLVYLCTDPNEAVRFTYLHGILDNFVFGVDLEESEVEESFDHSEAFFKCRAYCISRDILPSEINDNACYEYHLGRE